MTAERAAELTGKLDVYAALELCSRRVDTLEEKLELHRARAEDLLHQLTVMQDRHRTVQRIANYRKKRLKRYERLMRRVSNQLIDEVEGDRVSNLEYRNNNGSSNERA